MCGPFCITMHRLLLVGAVPGLHGAKLIHDIAAGCLVRLLLAFPCCRASQNAVAVFHGGSGSWVPALVSGHRVTNS